MLRKGGVRCFWLTGLMFNGWQVGLFPYDRKWRDNTWHIVFHDSIVNHSHMPASCHIQSNLKYLLSVCLNNSFWSHFSSFNIIIMVPVARQHLVKQEDCFTQLCLEFTLMFKSGETGISLIALSLLNILSLPYKKKNYQQLLVQASRM